MAIEEDEKEEGRRRGTRGRGRWMRKENVGGRKREWRKRKEEEEEGGSKVRLTGLY